MAPPTAPAPAPGTPTGAAKSSRFFPPGWFEGAPVTRAILGLNIAVFVLQALWSHESSSLGRMPVRAMLAFGANYGFATIGEHRYETLITACFLHAGIMHIAFNMVALAQAGPLVERSVGSARMAPMYLLAGAASSLVSTLVAWFEQRERFSVGASGAVSGVIAAALVIGWRIQGWRGPLTQAMARWLALVLVFGLVTTLSGGNIDNAAHVGGAVAGALIASMWKRGYVYSSTSRLLILAACSIVVLASGVAVAIRDATDPFATYLFEERIEIADRALEEERCDLATAALESAARLRPRASRVAGLAHEVGLKCH
jgi:membrane associated rhomboid family serine protease